MNITIRPMTRAEHNYSYSWGSHLMAASGCIGHLRGDMGSEGNGFYTTWFDHKDDLKTQDFKDELDTVVNALRFDAAYGGVLSSRGKLAAYCRAHPDSAMGTISREYGFRADTDKYTYMLRLTPNWGEYNFYIYCYVREQLDNYMTSAERGIRFVDSHYRDLFRLADGDSIRIIKPDGEYADRTCRYIGETHMTCGWDDRLYRRSAHRPPAGDCCDRPDGAGPSLGGLPGAGREPDAGEHFERRPGAAQRPSGVSAGASAGLRRAVWSRRAWQADHHRPQGLRPVQPRRRVPVHYPLPP